MTRTQKICTRLALNLRSLAFEAFYLEAATQDEVNMAVMSILADLYDHFDKQTASGTKLPYAK